MMSHDMADQDLNRYQRWRKSVRHIFETPDTLAEQVINNGIASLILISAVIFVLQTYDIPPRADRILDWLDEAILCAFTLEYGLRLWSAPKPLRYFFSIYGLIDLLATLPFLLGFLWEFMDLGFLRLLRWLRILRVVRFMEGQPLPNRFPDRDTLIVFRIVFTLFSIIFVYAGLIFQVEHGKNPESFRTFLDALYFAVVTMTTVGYGDMTPLSGIGRGLTVMMILTGIALIPTQIGKLIRQLTKVTNSLHAPCPACGLPDHDSDAQYCKRCGASLPAPKDPTLP